MELGLEHKKSKLMLSSFISFYPCFNGIRVGTKWQDLNLHTILYVSILVLMELGLERGEVSLDKDYFAPVSILVLMELGLEHINNCISGIDPYSFYPCFNGIRVGTRLNN